MSESKLDRRILRAMDRRIDKQLSRIRRGLRPLDFVNRQKYAEHLSTKVTAVDHRAGVIHYGFE